MAHSDRRGLPYFDVEPCSRAAPSTAPAPLSARHPLAEAAHNTAVSFPSVGWDAATAIRPERSNIIRLAVAQALASYDKPTALLASCAPVARFT